MSQTDPDLDRAVRTVVAEELGHSRPSIVSAYIGGVRPKGEPHLEAFKAAGRELIPDAGTSSCDGPGGCRGSSLAGLEDPPAR